MSTNTQQTVEAVYRARTALGSSIGISRGDLPLHINQLIVWTLQHPTIAADLIPYWQELRTRQADNPTRTELAHRIASLAAHELIQSEGIGTGAPDEYTITRDALAADQHLRDCVDYLIASGEAVQFDGACDGPDPEHIIILLGDFTLAGLAGDN